MRAKPKTKTAQLILQKQKQAKNQNKATQSASVPTLQNRQTLSKYIDSAPIFSYASVIDFIYQPSKSLINKGKNTQKQCEQCCQLQKQNFRLIQSNYGLIKKHKSIIHQIKCQLNNVIYLIEQYHYVDAIKIIYELLDRIKKNQCKQPQQQQNAQDVPHKKELADTLQRATSLVEEYKQPLIQEFKRPEQVSMQQYDEDIKTISKRQLKICSPIYQQNVLPVYINNKNQQFYHTSPTRNFATVMWREENIELQKKDQSMRELQFNSLQCNSVSPKKQFYGSQFSQKSLQRSPRTRQLTVVSAPKTQDLYRFMLVQAQALQASLLGNEM